MLLTTILLMMNLTRVFIQPDSSLSKDDQALATCIATAMSARPTAMAIAPSKEAADVTLVVSNRAALRIHVIGKLVRPDGSVMLEVNHVTHGLNHSLCHQADGLLDEMARKLNGK